ncbi:MAG: orotidine-5'-phosphate decarboxylase, partial [Ruminococcus sp.]|nr:orotidine-5'-phosphate decarboxylase [Ruminococcus sp.]
EAFDVEGYTLKAAAKAIYRFNKGIIDAVCDVVPAIKPQAAYYEMYGYYGVKALAKTIEYAKSKGIFVITDGKRNDIGATMEAYTNAHLGTVTVGDRVLEPFGADALTVNGYLGSDGIEPLLNACREFDKGIFVLVKTSNKSSGELQDRLIDGKPVYEIMGEMCEKWGESAMGAYGYSSVGAVVGATYPEQLKELREKLPHTFFLVPGYGAQGGGAEGVAKAFDKNGRGAIVNSSRAVMCAYKKEGCDETEYAAAALRECIRMKNDIISHIR